MKVRLRQRLQGKSNKSYLYLEYYKGAHVRPDGKTIYKREYEYLDLYLIDNPNNATEKKANAETLQFAEELRTQREVAIKNGKFTTMFRNTKSFLQYLDTIVEKRKGKKEFYN